ncbi:MAG: hypothetical protein LUC86_06770 [Prevotellaceae bacterium]|nr:hypothetical protein [Prevotellaceae bacterium]
MTESEYAALSLKEKEKYWIKALRQRSTHELLLSTEQYDYEMEPHFIYEDENIVLLKNYVDSFDIYRKDDETVGWGEEWLEFILEEVDMGVDLKIEGYEGKTFLEYMRDRGFPLTFRTWI